jgi:hypothetical protein
MSARRLAAAIAAISLVAFAAQAQVSERPAKPDARYVSIDAPVVALIHARVIDGTGAAARTGQTILIEGSDIKAVGPDAKVQVPAGARIIDLTGKSVLPGWVMVHEHLFYPTGPLVYANTAVSFAQLYLAGGATTIRTAGDLNGFGDLNLARKLREGDGVGPWVDATGPYLDKPDFLIQKQGLKDAADAVQMVNFWADHGATSFKAYMQIDREMLGAAIKTAHARGIKVTGHLCAVTARDMANVAIIGAQWGDEGKGKVVDWLASRADIVVRFQGGHNAGHTLVVGNQTYKLSLLPSGIVRGKLGIIGNGVVLDPDALLSEIEKVRGQGLDVGPHNLRIAENTLLILPLHPALDKAREAGARRGQDRHHRPRHRPGL